MKVTFIGEPDPFADWQDRIGSQFLYASSPHQLCLATSRELNVPVLDVCKCDPDDTCINDCCT